MKYKAYPIQIWFLDDDFAKSAQMLNNKHLNKTIDGCYKALVSAYFYAYGIRSKKFYKHYFSKELKQESLDRFFPCWPLKQLPSYAAYNTRTSKWCRKCKEHMDYVTAYMEALCSEYEYRTGKVHSLAKFLEWMLVDAPKIKVPIGNLKNIVLEWKVLAPKNRRKCILEGYRLQYKHVLQNDGIKVSDFTKRDIPEWLLEKDSKWLE